MMNLFNKVNQESLPELEGYQDQIYYVPDVAYSFLQCYPEPIYEKDEWEKIMSCLVKSPRYSYDFAFNVLKGRFERGEPAIARHPRHSFWYALKVLNGRFELGEDAIATDTEYSYAYSLFLGMPFKKGEVAISRNAEQSCSYAINVLGHRFESGEPAIKKSKVSCQRYEDHFNIKLT